MKINDGTFVGTEESVQPTDPKSPTSKRGMWIIIAVVALITLLIGALCFAMFIMSYMVHHRTQTETTSPKVVQSSYGDKSYRLGWLTLSEGFGQSINIDSDHGEHFTIETASDDVEVIEKVNGEKIFPMRFSLHDPTEYITKGQTFALALKAANVQSIGKKMVYCFYKEHTEPPSDWRLQAVRQMNGIN